MYEYSRTNKTNNRGTGLGASLQSISTLILPFSFNASSYTDTFVVRTVLLWAKADEELAATHFCIPFHYEILFMVASARFQLNIYDMIRNMNVLIYFFYVICKYA